jgi:hypothetical protein
MKIPIFMMLSLLTASAALSQPKAAHPQAEISNGKVRAKLYLPDIKHGY